jgi:hypothetical protein
MVRCHWLWARIGLGLASAIALSCFREKFDGSTVEQAFVENGVSWATGNAVIKEAPQEAFIIVRRTRSPAATAFTVEGFAKAPNDYATATGFPIEYVDEYRDAKRAIRKTLVFVSTWKFAESQTNANEYTVTAQLKKPGASFPERTSVPLGVAVFGTRDAEVGRMFPGTAGAPLRIYEIVDGIAKGRWAVSFLRASPAGQSAGCRFIGLIAGFLPNQVISALTPDRCSVATAELDFCANSSEDCDVKRVDQTTKIAGLGNFTGRVSGKYVSGPGADGSYSVPGVDDGVRIIFRSAAVSGTPAQISSGEICRQKFTFQAQSVDRRDISRGCRVTLGAATSEEVQSGVGSVCAVEVSFKNSQTILERNCFVQGIFWADPPDIQAVRIVVR